MKIYKNLGILFGILVVATILRFFHFGQLDFTHDEFSAFFRCHFDTFSDLIQHGVYTDSGHPAGVQVFLWLWVQLFGDSVVSMKLPFAICGVISVFLTYIVAQKWYNSTVSVVASAYMATLQYAIFYSQVARPYAIALCASLAMVYFWSNIIQNPDKKFYLNAAFFVIFASICSYTHYFALLFAFVVSMYGLFVIKRKYIVHYLVCGVAIFLLYVPHLGIFFASLSHKGIGGWLGAPRYDFLWVFIRYIFHYSWISSGIALFLIIFGIFQCKKCTFDKKKFFQFLIFFVVPFLVGFLYSRFVDPILQFSSLLFGFPYLLFVFFGHLKEQKPIVNLLFATAIVVANTFSLIYTRQHYVLMTYNIHKQIVIDAPQNSAKTLFLTHNTAKIQQFYCQKLQLSTDFVPIDSMPAIQLKNLLNDSTKSYQNVYLGAISSVDPIVVPMIRDAFPIVQSERNWFGGSTYLFSKAESQFVDNQIDGVVFLASDEEFSEVIEFDYREFGVSKNDFIDASVVFEVDSSLRGDGVLLCVVLEACGKTLAWQGRHLSDFVVDSCANSWNKAYSSLCCSDVHLPFCAPYFPKIKVKVYLWNSERGSCRFAPIQVRLRRGNPFLYGVTDPIE